jgi:replication factor C small subunit
MFELWVEKYRPKRLKDIVGQDEVIEALTGFVEKRSMPHLLFAGPAGTGKTTTALALANEIYGSEELVSANYMELNASDERGIDTIRVKIKDFAKTKALGEVPFKIIHLDEADNLTSDAQQALRRIMEMYSSNVRFILACNYSSKIIDPIQSRCAVFRFNPLADDAVIKRLNYIAEQEKIQIGNDGFKAIAYVAEGDLRKAINILQTAFAVAKGKISPEIVYKISGLAMPEEVNDIIRLALEGQFLEARTSVRNLMINYGISAEDLVRQLHRQILQYDGVDDIKKAEIVSYIGEIDFRLAEGGNGDIQISALLSKIASIGRGSHASVG